MLAVSFIISRHGCISRPTAVICRSLIGQFQSAGVHLACNLVTLSPRPRLQHSGAPVSRLRGVRRSPWRRAGSHAAAWGDRAARPASLPRRGRGDERSRPLRSGRIVRPPPILVSAIRMLIGQTRSRCAPPRPHSRMAVHRERPTGRHTWLREHCGGWARPAGPEGHAWSAASRSAWPAGPWAWQETKAAARFPPSEEVIEGGRLFWGRTAGSCHLRDRRERSRWSLVGPFVIIYAVAGWWRRGIVWNGRLRWGQTLFVDHLWARSQRRGHRPRRRDLFGADRGAVCIRVRVCGRHRCQRPPLRRGRGDVVHACFVAAAIFVGGRNASRERGRACSRAFSRPPLSLAPAAAPCARASCSWRPSFSVPAAGTRPF